MVQMAGHSPLGKSTARAMGTSGNAPHPLIIQPQKNASHGSSCSNFESLSRFSQSIEPGSDHAHNVRRPATSEWAFSPPATRRLRLTSIWTAGLAQCLPGQKTSLVSSQDLLTANKPEETKANLQIELDVRGSDGICCRKQHAHRFC